MAGQRGLCRGDLPEPEWGEGGEGEKKKRGGGGFRGSQRRARRLGLPRASKRKRLTKKMQMRQRRSRRGLFHLDGRGHQRLLRKQRRAALLGGGGDTSEQRREGSGGGRDRRLLRLLGAAAPGAVVD